MFRVGGVESLKLGDEIGSNPTIRIRELERHTTE